MNARPMRKNVVKAALREGRLQVGGWISLSDPLSAEIMARAGFDWLLVDMEHGPITPDAALAIMSAIRATAAIPFIRVAWNESAAIQVALDYGTFGIVVPVINDRAAAERLVQDARYPPIGNRSRGGLRAPTAFQTDATTYGRHADEEVMVMAMIETVEAVKNAGEIAAVEGIDGLFLGPNDLALSTGDWPLNWNAASPAFHAAVERVAKVAKAHGKFAGVQGQDAAQINRCIELGYTFVSSKSDAVLLAQGAAQLRKEMGPQAS